MHLRLRELLGFLLTVILLLLTTGVAHGQDSPSPPDSNPELDCSQSQSGALSLAANPDGTSEISLSYCVARAREANVRQELSQVLGCPPREVGISLFQNADTSEVELSCDALILRHGLRFTGEIDPEPIQKIFKSEGLGTLAVNIWMPRYGTGGCEPAPTKDADFPSDQVCGYVLEGESGVIRYWFGYDAPLVFRIAAILGFLLLIPFAGTLWMRHRALNVREETRTEIIFAYFKFLKWGTLGGALIWWAAIDLLHADNLVAFLIPASFGNYEELAAILPWLLLWSLPATVYFLCLLLSAPMHAIRGTKRTQRQLLKQAFWSVARFLAPIPLLILGIAELFSSPRAAVVLLAGSILAGKIARRQLAEAYGLELHALTYGELRDRAFAIAQKARARLNQLYVLPTEQLRMANAFAHIGNNIFLTDYLVKNLSKREVDAIVGHEVSHLQNRHIGKRLAIVAVAMAGAIYATAWSEHRLPESFPLGPVIYATLLAAIFFTSRRNEFAADAGAVKLTGDPEAMITSLVKVSRLNTMPMHWGKLDEKILTHPSTLRRITRLARTAGISEQRLPELINSAAAAPTEVYVIPTTALPAGKIFSTRYKRRLSSSIAWVMLLTAAVIPTATALTTQAAHLYGVARWLAYVLGFLLTIAVELMLANCLPLSGNSKLGQRLRDKLEKQSMPSQLLSGLFVSMSPDATPRIYEGNWAWDVGFLTITTDRLKFQGEEAQFSVGRGDIEMITLGQGPAGWWRSPSVYMTWRDASAMQQVCNLRVSRARSMREMARLTRQLSGELQTWMREIPLPAGSLLAVEKTATQEEKDLVTGRLGEVTSVSPRKLVGGAFLARMFLVDTFVALAVGILCGLRFPILDSVNPPVRSSALEPTGGAMLYVLGAVWFARAFQLWPYWRFREDESQAGPMIAAAIQER